MSPLKLHARLSLSLFALLIAHASPTYAQFSVSGTVQDNVATSIANVTVTLYDNSGVPIGIPLTVTNVSGFYSISGLPDGSYQLRFVPPSGVALLHSWEFFSISGSSQTVNTTLNPGHIISGFVRNSVGIGIPNIDLNLTDDNSGDPVETPGDNTDVSGFYDIVVPAGTYDIRYRPVNGEQLIPVEFFAVDILTDTTIDVTLLPATTLSGTVTGPGAIPVLNADIDVIDVVTGDKIDTPGDNTDLAGFYSVTIPPGEYDVDVDPLTGSGLAPAVSRNVIVTTDMTLDFSLEAGVTLSGAVRDPFSQAVIDVDIDLTNEATGEAVYLTTDKTNLSGDYSFSCPLGTFTVDFQPPLITGLAPLTVTGVTVSSDMTLNADLTAGLSLSGTVTNAFAAPVESVDIDAKSVPGELSVPLVGDNTDALGIFATLISPGVYDIEVEPPAARRLAALKLPALNLTVDTALTLTLDTGMVISGVVRDTDNTLFPAVRLVALTTPAGDTVFISSDKTDLAGAYSAIVPVGSYDLIYKPDSALGRSDSVIFAGVTIASDTTIDVTFSGAPPPPSHTISGTVTDPSLAPVANVDIILLTSGGSPISSYPDATNVSGEYTLPPIVEGDYWLYFAPEPGSGLVVKVVTGISLNSDLTVDVTLDLCPGVCGCCVTAGDANHDGKISIGDVTFLIARIFTGGAAPACNDEADANGDNKTSIGDVTFLIAHIFSGGGPPICGTTGS